MTLGTLYHKIFAFNRQYPEIAPSECGAFLQACRDYLGATSPERRSRTRERVSLSYKAFVSALPETGR